MASRAFIMILAEDHRQQNFVWHLLIALGYSASHLHKIDVPAGKGSGEQYVRREYPEQLKTYRRRAASHRCALVVVIDADDDSVEDRQTKLAEALSAAGLPARRPDEHVPVLVPKRNIETWIWWLRGHDVTETEDYKNRIQETRFPNEARELRERLRHGLRDDAPPSLHRAAKELSRLPK